MRDVVEWASVHRFRDHVAVYLRVGTGDESEGLTGYITAPQAHALAQALAAAARDIERQPDFSKSMFPTSRVITDEEFTL